MKRGTVIWDEYPENMEVAIPAKWIMVAENLLTQDQYKEWLYYTMKYFGVAGIEFTGDTEIDMVLHAVYEENEDFFDRYYNSLLRKKLPLEDLLKVFHVRKKEEQLNAYRRRAEAR